MNRVFGAVMILRMLRDRAFSVSRLFEMFPMRAFSEGSLLVMDCPSKPLQIDQSLYSEASSTADIGF